MNDRIHHSRHAASAAWRAFAWLVAAATLAAIVPAAPAGAQNRYLAYGDSITRGDGFDVGCNEDCGYPSRLEDLLQADGLNVTVENHGSDGERTDAGLSRLPMVLDDVVAGPTDVLLLMEGTNDITRGMSPETTLFNLSEMARLTNLRGTQVVHATLIPRFPEATVDANNELNQDLAWEIRNLAFTSSRNLVDPFEVFFQQANLFDTYYDENLSGMDPVGHPNPAGFDLLAETFWKALTGRDDVPPVVGAVEPADGAAGVAALARIKVRVYDFGTGINASSASMTINGINVPVDVSFGGSNWLDIEHRPLDELPGNVRVRVQVADFAFPANVLNQRVTTFAVDTSGPDPCVPSPTTLCLDDNPGDQRFRVRMSWETVMSGGQSGIAFATPLAPVNLETGGLLSFFEGTPEVLIKVLDGCGVNGHYWVFGAPTTTLGYELIVEDTVAKAFGAPPSRYQYVQTNTDGSVAQPFADIEAFDTCDYP